MKVLNEVDNITTTVLSNNELKLSDIAIGSENELLNDNLSKDGVDILNGEENGNLNLLSGSFAGQTLPGL